MVISFSGTSGAGKSKIIAEIKKGKIFSGKKVVIKEEDSFITIRLLKFILGENIFSRYKEEKFFRRQYNGILYRLFSVFSYTFYPVCVYVEYLIEYIWYQMVLKDTILLADRFMYDYEVTFKNVVGIDNRFSRWLFNRAPRPYLSFLIDINLTLALLKRNKNNIPGKITANKAFHQSVILHYRKIAKEHSLLAVDNNGNLDDAVKSICGYITNKKKLLDAKRIAICGLDGTGKTTVANKLAEYANNLNVKCTVVHFYHENLLFKFLRLLGFLKVADTETMEYAKRRERSLRERSKTTPFVLAFLRFFDSYLQYLYSVVVNRDKLIIFDRFFYDYSVSFEYLKIPFRSVFIKLIPHIEQRFILESSPTISYKRKPESVKIFFEECHKIYLKVAQEQKIKIIKNENKKIDVVVQELIESIS